MTNMLESIYFSLPTVLQNELISFYGRRLWKKRYGVGFEQRMADIKELDALKTKALNKEISHRLSATIMFAGEHIPYYRELFDKHQIRPQEIDSIDALAVIPPLEKEVLRANPEAFQLAGAAKRTYAIQVTSGSTGTPLSLCVDRDTYQLAMGLLLYYETIHGVKAGDSRATFAGRMVQRAKNMRPPFWRYNRAENQMLFSSYHLNENTVGEYVRGLDSFAPSELIGYPSSIATLASLMKDGGYTLNFRPKLVVTNSETLFEWQRELITDVLHAPVHDYYGTAEYLVFGWELSGRGYRLHPALGVVETVDNNDQPIWKQPGELLCTTLSNRVMPLIRFRIGDVATLAHPDSHPDMGGQILTGIEGRIDDIVIAADGRRIGRLDHIFKGVEGIRECQVIQHGTADFELVLAPAEGYTEAVPALIEANLEHRMGYSCQVKISLVDRVPRGANGKFKGVISLVEKSTD